MSELSEALQAVKASMLELLYSRVARHLARRSVRVEFVQPVVKTALGLAALDGGQAVIQIRPGMSKRDEFATYLHECAHVRLHYDKLPVLKTTAALVAPRGTLLAKIQTVAAQPRENEADNLAAKWLAYADRMAPGGDIAKKLITLLDWQT